MGAMVNLLLADFVQGLLNVMLLVMSIADTVLIVYAVYLFFMMATASTEDKRRKVKKRIFTALSSIFIIIALVSTLAVIKVNITSVQREEMGSGSGSGGGSGGGSVPAVFEGATIDNVTMKVNLDAGIAGGFTEIATGNIHLNNGATVIGMESLVITGSGDFSNSGDWHITAKKNSSGFSIQWGKEVGGGDTYTYCFKADSQIVGTTPQYYVPFTVRVAARDANGEAAATNMSGRIILRSGGGTITFK